MAIDSVAKWFVCIPCGQAIPPSTYKTHARNTHPTSDKISPQYITELKEQYDLHAKLPPFPPRREPYPMFPGIIIQKMYGCPHCPLAGVHKYVSNHRSTHSHEPGFDPTYIEENVYTQLLHPSLAKTHLRVLPDASVSDTAAIWIDKFLAIHSNLEKIARDTPNARQISPWLMRTKFHLLLPNTDHKHLRALVALQNTDTKYLWVSGLVRTYLANASKMILDTCHQVLRIINSDQPDRECVTTPNRSSLPL